MKERVKGAVTRANQATISMTFVTISSLSGQKACKLHGVARVTVQAI